MKYAVLILIVLIVGCSKPATKEADPISICEGQLFTLTPNGESLRLGGVKVYSVKRFRFFDNLAQELRPHAQEITMLRREILRPLDLKSVKDMAAGDAKAEAEITRMQNETAEAARGDLNRISQEAIRSALDPLSITGSTITDADGKFHLEGKGSFEDLCVVVMLDRILYQRYTSVSWVIPKWEPAEPMVLGPHQVYRLTEKSIEEAKTNSN